MAGTQERSTNQALTTERKNKIGEFYLLRLIRNNFPVERSDWGNFEEFNNGFDFKETGTKIPPLLFDHLNLMSLKWRGFGPQQPTILYIGRPPQGNNPMTTDINEATATIEIARRSERFDFGWPRGWGDKFTPFYVRIAGVNQEQNRIVAATYDMENDNRLTRLNVSLPASEAISINNDDYLNRILINKFWTTIPTDKNNPYQTAGLITQMMCDMSDKPSPMQMEYANKVLSFEFLGERNLLIGTSVNLDDQEALKYAFSKMGYYIFKKDGKISVGLTDSDTKRKYLRPWKISVPEFLQKV